MSEAKLKCQDCCLLFHSLEFDKWCEECFDIGLKKDMDEHFKNAIKQEMEEHD